MSASDAAPLPRMGEVFFDVRGDSRSMRLSWYADTGVAVFSIWQGGTCTGTFRLPIADLPRMVAALRRGPRGMAGEPGDTEASAREGDHGGPARRRPSPGGDADTGQQTAAFRPSFTDDEPATGPASGAPGGYPDPLAAEVGGADGFAEPTVPGSYPDPAANGGYGPHPVGPGVDPLSADYPRGPGRAAEPAGDPLTGDYPRGPGRREAGGYGPGLPDGYLGDGHTGGRHGNGLPGYGENPPPGYGEEPPGGYHGQPAHGYAPELPGGGFAAGDYQAGPAVPGFDDRGTGEFAEPGDAPGLGGPPPQGYADESPVRPYVTRPRRADPGTEPPRGRRARRQEGEPSPESFPYGPSPGTREPRQRGPYPDGR